MKKLIILSIIGLSLLSACNNNDDMADAYGNFESNDQLVTAEIPGKILFFNIEEGQQLSIGDTIGLVDTTQLYLKKIQLKAAMKAIRGKLQIVQPQIDLINKQLEVLSKEKRRVKSLVAAEAATQKSLDDIQGKIDVFEQQTKTLTAQNKLANAAILSQIPPIKTQLLQLDDQISRCYITNPRGGTVLMKLAESGEIANPLKPLYKIADLSSLNLRAYVSGEQLPSLTIGQTVNVEIDKDADTNHSLVGKVSWIADRAEFTPKTIQTKEERVNLVYAFKVKVENDSGLLKIGMPGEVHFQNDQKEQE